MEIKKLKLKSKNNANIFIAETDQGEFELHSDIIVKAGIKIGQIEEKDFYSALDESSKLIAFNLCVKYIGAKLKTEKQIKDYLYKKDYKTNTIKAVLEKLKEYGIINDSTYAEMYIRSNSNFSKNKLKQKLRSFGVKDDNMDSFVEEIDDTPTCFRQAEKFFKNKDITKENIEKLTRRLASQGYNWDTIKIVLQKFKSEVGDDDDWN